MLIAIGIHVSSVVPVLVSDCSLQWANWTRNQPWNHCTMATVACLVECTYMQAVSITLRALGPGCLGNGADAISVDGPD